MAHLCAAFPPSLLRFTAAPPRPVIHVQPCIYLASEFFNSVYSYTLPASMSEVDQDDVITQFMALAGCDRHVADNYLVAHDYDLERSLDFFYEHPPGPEQHAELAPAVQPTRAQLQQTLEGHPIDIDEDDEIERAIAASRGQEGACRLGPP